MAAEKQRKTFLSYSRANKDFAVRLAKELKSEGFYVWLDQLDIPAGSRWDVEVEKALEECEIFMIIMTPSAISSENVRDEMGYAIDNGKRFLPVLLESCTVPLRLRRFQYVDFTNKSFDDGVESAKELLRSLIAQTTIPRAEFTGSQVQAEAERLARQKADEESAAKLMAETERKAREESERLALQKAEEERTAKTKAEADRKAKREADRLAKQKAEEERLAIAKVESDRKAKEEADRLAAQKAEADRVAKQKVEEERSAKAKIETERKAKEEADRLAAQKAEADRVAKQKVEEERLAKAKAETDRKAKEQADRLAAQKAETDRVAKQKAENERLAKVETERKAKEKLAPVAVKPEAGSIAPVQKKPISRGLVIGLASVFLLVVAVVGFTAFSNRETPAVTEAPVLPTEVKGSVNSNTVTSAPVSTPTPKPTSIPTSTSVSQLLMVSDKPIALNKITVDNASQLELLTKLNPNTISDILAFSPDGTTLVSGLAKEAYYEELWGSDIILVWDLSVLDKPESVKLPGILTSLSYDEDYIKIASCETYAWYGCLDSNILHWQLADQSLTHKALVSGLVYTFPPNEAMPMVLHLSTESWDQYQLWDVDKATPEFIYQIIQTDDYDASISYSIDGEHYAIGLGTVLKLYKTNSDQPVLLEDPNEENKNRFSMITFSPDGSILASGNGGGKIKLWQMPNGTFLRELEGHTKTIDAMVFSPDGSLLVSISSDNTLRVWDVASGASLITMNDVCSGKGYKSARCALAFSPTGSLFASIGWPDKNILMWGIK